MLKKTPNPGNPTTGGQTDGSTVTFTKERVNELMQRRIERSHQAFFNRYGVKDLNELDDLFSKAAKHDELNQRIQELLAGNSDWENRYNELLNQNRDLTKKYAFSSRNIRPEMYSDIETYFKGKGLDINEETLNEELKTHLDWCSKPGVVVPLGNETHSSPVEERELANKFLGM